MSPEDLRPQSRFAPRAPRAKNGGMRAMALDLGSKTIGLAGGDLASRIASPWEVLDRQGNRADFLCLCERVRKEAAKVVVVGLPLELDGSLGHRARLVKRFVEGFVQALQAANLDARVVTWDERFSTAAAQRSMLEGDLSRKRRKTRVDAVAAQMILSGWMQANAQRFLSTDEGEPHE